MEIHWRNLAELAPAARGRVEQRLRALAEGRGDLIDVHLAAKTTRHHVHGGCEVSVRGLVRGRELVASRTRPDLGQALNEALDAFEAELRRLRERRTARRSVQEREAPEQGVIDRIDPEAGFGFILTDSGERVYFHRNALRPELRFEELAEGQRVGLDFEAGEKGLQAKVVMPSV